MSVTTARATTCEPWCVDHRYECSRNPGECHGVHHDATRDDGQFALQLNLQRYADPIENRLCIVVHPKAGAEQIEFIELPGLIALLTALRDFRPQALEALEAVAVELGVAP